jgi:hypothetical protein
MLSSEKYKIQGEINSYVHCLSLQVYGYMSVEKLLLRFGEAVLCIFRFEVVEVFVNGVSELQSTGNYLQITRHDVPGKFNL